MLEGLLPIETEVSSENNEWFIARLRKSCGFELHFPPPGLDKAMSRPDYST